MQGDNPRVRFVIGMTEQRTDWCPSFKLAHYNYFRIRWASFKCPLPSQFVCFININSLGEGKQDERLLPTAMTTTTSTVASTYTASLPIEQNVKVSFDYTSDIYGWIPLPEGVNLKKFTIFAYPELSTAGAAPPGFVTASNPLTMELEFTCDI
eukprot:gene4097-biopygen753